MRFFKTQHNTSTMNGDQVATVNKPKGLPQEAQIFHVEWGINKINVTWWIPDQIMPTGGFTEKS